MHNICLWHFAGREEHCAIAICDQLVLSFSVVMVMDLIGLCHFYDFMSSPGQSSLVLADKLLFTFRFAIRLLAICKNLQELMCILVTQCDAKKNKITNITITKSKKLKLELQSPK